VLSLYALLAYITVAQPRTLWPIRNGGIEALLYCVVFLYFAAAGGGAWSLDAVRQEDAGAGQKARLYVPSA
jgi:putative oxidoreductase